jgi:hypothetical protein
MLVEINFTFRITPEFTPYRTFLQRGGETKTPADLILNHLVDNHFFMAHCSD